MELATQLATSHVPTVTSTRLANAPKLARSSINSAQVKIIVVGALESGRTVLVLDIKSDASLAGIVTRTQQPTIAQKRRSQHRDNDAVHHQIVRSILSFLSSSDRINFGGKQAHAKAFNITNEHEPMANIKSIFEGMKSKFIVTI